MFYSRQPDIFHFWASEEINQQRFQPLELGFCCVCKWFTSKQQTRLDTTGNFVIFKVLKSNIIMIEIQKLSNHTCNDLKFSSPSSIMSNTW